MKYTKWRIASDMDTAARVRRRAASRRHEVGTAWCRYRITNNRYQSMNLTLNLSCQSDADMNVTDAASRVCGEWRHAVAMSNVDAASLSNYEQPLPIRKRDAGIVTARDANMNVTDVATWMRRGVATR